MSSNKLNLSGIAYKNVYNNNSMTYSNNKR